MHSLCMTQHHLWVRCFVVVVCWLLECTISQFNLLTPATYLMSPRKVHRKATFYLRNFLFCKFVVKIAGFSVVRVARSSVFYVHILPLHCLSFDLRILITPLVSSNTYLPFCPFLFVVALSVLLRFTNSDYPNGIFKFFFVIFLYAIVLSVFRFPDSDYSYGIFSVCKFSLGHCIVCPSMYGFFFVLVVKIAGRKFCSLEIKQESIIHSFFTFIIGWPTFSDLNCKRKHINRTFHI